MDFKISSRIWSTNLPSGEKTVLLALDHSGDSDGFSWQGYDKLADMTGISKDSKYLTRILNKLEQKGHLLIWRQHGHKGGRGYTHIYWPIIGRTDEEILEIVTRRFIATEDEAGAIISQSGPIYDELVKRGRVSGKILEESRAIKKGVPQYTNKNEKGVLDNPNSKERVYQDTPKIEAENKKGVPDSPRSESSNPESKPDKESKILSPKQHVFLALAEICRIDLKVSTDKQQGQLGQASAVLCKSIADVDLFKTKFNIYWTKIDWRGKQGQAPTPAQVREIYGDYCHWLESGEGIPVYAQKASQNGYHGNKSTKRTNPPLPPATEAEQARLKRMAAATVAPDDS